MCAFIACLNAACWSIVTPPFQVLDEPDHFAYAQHLAETGELPDRSAPTAFSTEEIHTLDALYQGIVRFKQQFPAISSLAEQRALQRTLSSPLARGGSISAANAGSEPPLYYALETVPYDLGSGGNLLERLQLMRLLSALMAGLTALFTFLFVREALPGAAWAWTVGALGVALMPLLGFISGGVNPESMLIAVSAAGFYLLARAFRHGFTLRLAIALGLVIATGFLTKLNFIGLAPGMLLGAALLSLRTARTSPRHALRSLAVSWSVGCAPVIAYLLINLLAHRATLGTISETRLHPGYAFAAIGYIWQLYLPALPYMRSYFPGVFMPQIWFDALVGLYGWIDTVFPGWVLDLALAPTVLLATLSVRELRARRRQLRGRLPELLVYGAIAGGLMVLVGATSYIGQTYGHERPYLQPRYFLPLTPLLAVVLALAARGAGRRWGHAAGALIVVMFFAYDIFSQLQVIARYYG
jgi:4-amino-4-deoxy-L-arabinose transferase-like glycosyltransferase